MDFNNMSLYDDISPQALIIIGTALAVIFVFIVCRMYCDIRVLRKGRKELDQRIQHLRLNDMIGRLKINREKYLLKTSDLDKERHIWACEHCPEPEECEDMFAGEDIDPETFCPNADELERLKESKLK